MNEIKQQLSQTDTKAIMARVHEKFYAPGNADRLREWMLEQIRLAGGPVVSLPEAEATIASTEKGSR